MNILFKILLIFIISILNLYSSTTNIEKSVFKNSELKKDPTVYLKKYLRSKEFKSYISRSYTKKFYKDHSYKLFWSDEHGLKNITHDLLNKIKNDSVLKPLIKDIFNLIEIEKYLGAKSYLQEEELVKLDVLLTGTYYFYMHYLSRGVIDWEKFQEELTKLYVEEDIIANWKKYDVRKNVRKLLYKAVKKDDINIAINEVNFTYPYAKELEKKLLDLEKLASIGGFTKIPKLNKPLRKNNEYTQIPFLRQRLLESGDLAINNCEKTSVFNANKVNSLNKQNKCTYFYDEILFNAVKSFQKRHGLIKDGIVGINTKRKLNEPIENIIKKIRINLERMRWMPRTFGEKHIVVNIPDFKFKLFNKEELQLEMPVIVGLPKHPTPIFSHRMSEIVLNPYWRIPQRIVKNEIIPELLKDSNYLVHNEINVYENWDHKSMQYDVSAVDWNMYQDNELIGTSKEAPMRFIQVPGEKNPLGKIKFLFPNKYSVYMHDTPYKELFNTQVRTFSHGCIRLAEPNELFKTIAIDEKQIDFEKANEFLENKERIEIELEKKIRIHVIYLTSWIDENGILQLRDDIYNYDKIQGNILFPESL